MINVIIPFESTKILEPNQHQKSDQAPFIIYAALERLMDVKITLKVHLQQK